MKEVKYYSRETTFEPANKTMTHIFSDRVKVVCDFCFGIITILRDDDTIDKFSFEESEMTVGEYKRILPGIAETAEELKQFGL